MTSVDIIVLDFIHVFVPFLVYLFYIAYKNSFDDRENKLAIFVTIFSTLYIVLKYNIPVFSNIPMVLVALPLLISMIKRNDIAVVLSSIVAIFYYYNFYNGFLIFICLLFLVYLILYKVLFNKIGINLFCFIFTFLLIGTLFIITFCVYPTNLVNCCFGLLLLGIVFYIISISIICLLDKTSELLNFRITVKEIEHDKQIKNSLFQITHEIKNPIAVCKGYLDMFDSNNSEHSKKYIPIIKEEIDKTLFLLEDFLSMNRIRINKELLDINYLLSNFIDHYDPYFKENKIETDIVIDDDEVYLDGDYNRLFQVFTNVMKNSIEALKENPMIKVWTEIKGDSFYVYIRDNGEGITEDVLKKMKEPFFTTKMRGTGLGVPLSSEIIEAHGGKLLYDSKLGEYTLTTIILPISKWD